MTHVEPPGDRLMTPHVWIFSGVRNHFPSAVFYEKEQAETWIAENGLSGTLTKYPVGISVYDWAVKKGVFVPTTAEHASPDFVANFSSAAQEHFHFEHSDD
jgi:hypothetical protein